MRMMEDSFFANKKILVINQEQKNKNDRTWCFWETGEGLFEPFVYHQWEEVNFYSDDFFGKLNLQPYRYKMIRGIDFYHAVINRAADFPNIEFRYETIVSIGSSKTRASVVLRKKTISADFVFNSILFEDLKHKLSKNSYHLIQHFKGWVIKTENDCFDPSVATLMDFRISQEHGTTFFYVMPTSRNEALIEYTLFTDQLLPDASYDIALMDYIRRYLCIDEFKIQHSEFGKIPMTNQAFKLQDNRIIQMGQAGGQIKGSSGYAFQFIQKRTAAIIKELKNGKTVFDTVGFHQKKGNLYDAVLLNVLHHHKMPGHKIFASIFSKNKTVSVLRFLDNESNLIEDLQIMNSVPTAIFFPAAMQELIP